MLARNLSQREPAVLLILALSRPTHYSSVYGGEMRFPLVPLRVKRWGQSLALILPKNLREDMNIHEGDIIAIRIHTPYATFCVWPMSKLAPLGEVDVRALPPRDPMKTTNA